MLSFSSCFLFFATDNGGHYLFFFVFLFIIYLRVDPAYESGATKFVRDVAAALGGLDMIVRPCIDCRNIDRHSGDVVVDHLVTRGMDVAYKNRSG